MAQYTVSVWKATHRSGTKFYQVVRIVGPGGSCAITHYGPNAVFINLGQVTAGTADFEEVIRVTNAGKSKIVQKKKDGYTENTIDEVLLETDTHHELAKWVRDNIKLTKVAGPTLKFIRGADFTGSMIPGGPPGAPAAAFIPEPELTPEEKHKNWGDW